MLMMRATFSDILKLLLFLVSLLLFLIVSRYYVLYMIRMNKLHTLSGLSRVSILRLLL